MRREIKARYAYSSLGLAWSLVGQLTGLLIHHLAIGMALGPARSILSLDLFVLIGLCPGPAGAGRLIDFGPTQRLRQRHRVGTDH